MKTSARNQFRGKVIKVRKGPISAEVEIGLNGNDRLVAIVTQESVDALGLAPGKEVWALVKASWVLVAAGTPPEKLSARNQLRGSVSRVTKGGVNAEVIIAIDGGDSVTASITNDAVDDLGLAPGAAATAIIKATNIILAVA